MLVKCPSCHTEYDCEPGRYRCTCGAEFSAPPEPPRPAPPSASAMRFDDMDMTIAPHRTQSHSGMQSQEAMDVTMPGRRERKPDGRFGAGDLILGRYKVLSELGQGGMGVVYRCFDETAGIEIALKALPPELSHNSLEMEDIRENFRLVHNLHHPNIASYNTLEKDNSNGNYYLVMECASGEDLRGWIRRKRRENGLTLKSVLPVVRQVAAALDYAHEEKIIHRDIKPGNIMIDQAGHVKVLDFGLAAQIHTSMTRVSMATGETSGTAPYMAPEQWRGRAQGAAADQYALAVMTYEMLAGHLPFDTTDMSVLREVVLNEAPEPVQGISAQAQQALKRGMAKAPADRFDSCSDFVAALSAVGKPFVTAKPAKDVFSSRVSNDWNAGSAAPTIQVRSPIQPNQRQIRSQQQIPSPRPDPSPSQYSGPPRIQVPPPQTFSKGESNNVSCFFITLIALCCPVIGLPIAVIYYFKKRK